MKIDYTDFLFGGLASTLPTVFTNPFEVIKTRIQLQGEMAAHGTYAKPYKSILSAFLTVFKNEGIYGLQKGLVPAFYFQFFLNATRLGVYNSALKNNLVHSSKTGEFSILKAAFWGGTGGVIGALGSSPFFLIKTQFQSQAPAEIAVGHQHHHASMSRGLLDIYSKNGVKGLWRGCQSTIPRAVLGSSAQIGSFGFCKDFLRNREIVVNKTLNSFAAATMAGSVMSLALTPPDLIATRLYNQNVDEKGKGVYYKGVFDAFTKIWKTEGFFGLYKGFWANYLRIVPHTAVLLLLFDELKYLWESKTK